MRHSLVRCAGLAPTMPNPDFWPDAMWLEVVIGVSPGTFVRQSGCRNPKFRGYCRLDAGDWTARSPARVAQVTSPFGRNPSRARAHARATRGGLTPTPPHHQCLSRFRRHAVQFANTRNENATRMRGLRYARKF